MADVSVVASPLESSSTFSGSGVAGFSVIAEAMSTAATFAQIVHTKFPPAVINPNLDQILYPLEFNLTSTITGTWFNVTIKASELSTAGTITGSSEFGGVWSSSSIMSATIKITDCDAVFGVSKKNWVKWSNIGALDFTVWKDNISGERPLDFNGWVYQLKKLNNKVIAYGQNGITALLPAGNTYGMQSIFQLGLKGKQAVCGTDTEHYFVDTEGRLWGLSESIEKLDYSEYLSQMSSSMTLSLDKETGLIYICDGEYGYVYSPRDKSMGECPNNITGSGSRSGTSYITASTTITNTPFEICTDIYDFGTRRAKTIRNIQLGTDLTNALTVAIEYRRDKSSAWSITDYRTVNAEGFAFITCYGNEFRVRIKCSAYEYFELDYININGEVHDY